MKKFLALTIAVLFLSIAVPEICQSASTPKDKKVGTADSTERKQDKDPSPMREKNSHDNPGKKGIDTNMQELEYDMDLEIDFEEERC